MTVMETVHRIRQRVLMEFLDLHPIEEPASPKAEWPAWTNKSVNLDKELKLRVLSLNAWGLPISPQCTERAFEIGNAIQGDWEIVVLQEIWHRRERNIIISAAEKAGFQYYHYFHAAVGFPLPFGHDSFGTGLLVLSKFPIVGATYNAFALSGRPYALHEADFIANKGVGLLRVQTPAGQIDLYVTHLLANYNHLGKPGPGDKYLAQRTAQAYELARFISSTSRNDLVIVCGDFNSPSECLVLQIPRDLTHLRDAFTDTNKSDGLTFATADNKYSHGDHPMRMDYILYKITEPSRCGWRLVRSKVYKGFYTDEAGEQCPLSDHFGVMAEFVYGSLASLAESKCQHAIEDTSEKSDSSLSKSLSCATTTCVYCDKVRGSEDCEADASRENAIACLQLVHDMMQYGQTQAMARRAGHLSRSGWSFLLMWCVLVARVTLVENNLLLFVALLMLLHVMVEYILAFFFVTLECSSFIELANQVRLHIHAEQANVPVF